MNKKIILLSAIAAMATVACTEVEPQMPADKSVEMTFGAEVTALVSKTTLTDGNKVVWCAADLISIFDGTANNPFSIKDFQENSGEATFIGTAAEVDTYYAAYPYSAQNKLSGTTVSLLLSASQNAVAGTFDDGYALAVAKAAEGNLAFQNVTSLVKVNIAEDQTNVKSISLKGNDGEALAGTISVTLDADGNVASISAAGKTEVTMTGNIEAGKSYYFTIAGDIEFTKGLTFTVNLSDGKSAVISGDQTITVGRGMILPLFSSLSDEFWTPSFTVAPAASISTYQNASPSVMVNFTAEDRNALDYVSIEIPGVDGYPVKLDAEGAATLTKSVEIALPSSATDYNMTVRAVNKGGFEAVTTSVITVKELTDFPKIYLADVADASQLTSDLFGVPMMVARTGEYAYTAYYYSKTEGTEIRFIPQKNDFNPICFGVDPNNVNALTSDPATALPIVLPGKGYYEIAIDIWNNTYSVQTHTPDTEVLLINNPDEYEYTIDAGDGVTQMPFHICVGGYGWADADWTMNWNAGARIMTKDPENPYVVYTDFIFTQAQVKFCIGTGHYWGWWPTPYWKFETNPDSGENEYNTLNTGNDMTEVLVPDLSVKYRLEFDYHLLRSKLVPIE